MKPFSFAAIVLVALVFLAACAPMSALLIALPLR